MNDARSEKGVSEEAFNEKKDYFEKIWEEIVTATDSCINLLDDGEDEGGEIVETLKEHLEELQYKKQRLTWLEKEIEKKLANMVESKSVELIHGDALLEMRKKALDGADVEELSSVFIEELDDKSIKEAVDQSELFESTPGIGETGGGDWS